MNKLQIGFSLFLCFLIASGACERSSPELTDRNFESYMDSTRAQVLESNYSDSLQNKLAPIYFDYYQRNPDSKKGRDAIARAFLYWGNTGNHEQVTRALQKIEIDSATWGRIYSYIPNAYYRSDPPAKAAYLDILKQLDQKVNFPVGESEILSKMSTYHLQENNRERAKELFQQIIDMNADSGDVAAAEGSLYELENLQVGMKAPEFTVHTLQGDTISLADLKGKLVLLDFWATWCGPCLPYIPHLKIIHDTFDGEEFQLVGLAFNKSDEDVLAMMEEKQMNWPQAAIHERFASDLAENYNINNIPRTYIIDEKGNIAAKDVRRDKLQEKIDELLAK